MLLGILEGVKPDSVRRKLDNNKEEMPLKYAGAMVPLLFATDFHRNFFDLVLPHKSYNRFEVDAYEKLVALFRSVVKPNDYWYPWVRLSELMLDGRDENARKENNDKALNKRKDNIEVALEDIFEKPINDKIKGLEKIKNPEEEKALIDELNEELRGRLKGSFEKIKEYLSKIKINDHKEFVKKICDSDKDAEICNYFWIAAFFGSYGTLLYQIEKNQGKGEKDKSLPFGKCFDLAELAVKRLEEIRKEEEKVGGERFGKFLKDFLMLKIYCRGSSFVYASPRFKETEDSGEREKILKVWENAEEDLKKYLKEAGKGYVPFFVWHQIYCYHYLRKRAEHHLIEQKFDDARESLENALETLEEAESHPIVLASFPYQHLKVKQGKMETKFWLEWFDLYFFTQRSERPFVQPGDDLEKLNARRQQEFLSGLEWFSKRLKP